jgi:hypothetical protein
MQRGQINAIVYGVIVSWTAFPIVGLLIAMAVSVICGCTVNEGSPIPCIVFGVDIGKALYTLTAMGWLAIVTLPTGGIAFALYTIFVVAQSRISRRR